MNPILFKILLWLSCSFFSANVEALDPTPSKKNLIQFDHLEENTVFFKTIPADAPQPPPLKTKLFELSYLGALQPAESLPYFFFGGKNCQNCSEDRAIYVLQPSSSKPQTFVYPGKIFETKSRELLLESRAFYGQCLPKRDPVFVIFQREKIDRRKFLQSSVLIVEPSLHLLEENLLERHLPSIQPTLQRVKKKVCFEIEGRNRIMQSKSLEMKF